MANVSRDTFDYAKKYTKVIFQYRKHVLDAELNEMQDIINGQVSDNMSQLYSSGGQTYGLDAVENTGDTVNKLKLDEGFFVFKNDGALGNPGFMVVRVPEQVIDGFTTPGSLRTDTLFIDAYYEEIDGTEDPDIVDPTEGAETSRRVKLVADLLIAENQSGPGTPPAGHSYFELARVTRNSGDTTIESGDIDTSFRTRATLRISFNDLQDKPTVAGATYVQDNDPSSPAGGSHDIDEGDRWYDTSGGAGIIILYIAGSGWSAGGSTDWVQWERDTHAAEHEIGGGDEIDVAQLSGQGSGNGLDADTVDTRHASYLLDRANHTGIRNLQDATIHNTSGSPLSAYVLKYALSTNKWEFHAAAWDLAIRPDSLASAGAAGVALKAALESATTRSIFLHDGIYDCAGLGPILQATSQVVFCAAGAEIRLTDAGQYLNVATSTRWYNGLIDGLSTGGHATRGLVDLGNQNDTHMSNLYVANSATSGFYADPPSANDDGPTLVGCLAVQCADSGFVNIKGLDGCIATRTAPTGSHYGFESCINVVNCEAERMDMGFTLCDGLSNVVAEDCVIGFNGCDMISSANVFSPSTGGFNSCARVSGARVVADSACTYGFQNCSTVSGSLVLSNGNINVGFDICEELSGCDVKSTLVAAYQNCNQMSSSVCTDHATVGFIDCHRMSACYAYDSDQTGSGHGFHNCSEMDGCLANNNSGHGFYICNNITGCKASTSGADGFNACTALSGCTSSANTASGFASCGVVAGCRATGHTSTTGFFSCLRVSACLSDSNDIGYSNCIPISACEANACTTYGYSGCDGSDLVAVACGTDFNSHTSHNHDGTDSVQISHTNLSRYTFDVIIDAAKGDTGATLASALTNSSVASIYVKAGVYSYTGATISQANDQLVLGEGGTGPVGSNVVVQFNTAGAGLDVGQRCRIENIVFDGTSTAGIVGGALVKSTHSRNSCLVNCLVKNSATSGFDGGFTVGNLPTMSLSLHCGFLLCHALGNTHHGFMDAYKLEGCTARTNTLNGFDSCANLVGCDSYDNADHGYSLCHDLSNCRARENDDDGFVSCFQMSSCVANGNVVGFNTCVRVSGSSADSNSGAGFYLGNQFSACNAQSNGGGGFLGTSGTKIDHVVGCVSSNNTSGYGFEYCVYLAGCGTSGNASGGFANCTHVSSAQAQEGTKYTSCDFMDDNGVFSSANAFSVN